MTYRTPTLTPPKGPSFFKRVTERLIDFFTNPIVLLFCLVVVLGTPVYLLINSQVVGRANETRATLAACHTNARTNATSWTQRMYPNKMVHIEQRQSTWDNEFDVVVEGNLNPITITCYCDASPTSFCTVKR